MIIIVIINKKEEQKINKNYEYVLEKLINSMIEHTHETMSTKTMITSCKT